MAVELDYAFLADYATVENGKLTAVGASFITIAAPTTPFHRAISIAGRVRLTENEEGFQLGIAISSPNDEWRADFGGYLEGTQPQNYDGKQGVLFALQSTVPLPTPGLYAVDLTLNGAPVRTLKFDVVTPQCSDS